MVQAEVVLRPPLQAHHPTREVLMASWSVVYGREDVSRQEGREDDSVEAPRTSNNLISNKIHMKKK